jgi:hypothetical protein
MLNISMLGNLIVQLQPCCAVTGCCDAAVGAGFVNRVTGYSLPASSFDGPTHLILCFCSLACLRLESAQIYVTSWSAYCCMHMSPKSTTHPSNKNMAHYHCAPACI